MSSRLTKITPITRGDTPQLLLPVTVNGVAADLTGYTAYLTITKNSNPTDNTDAVLHTAMTTDTANSQFTYQFTNTDTENLDPTAVHYVDVQINKSPTSTNNFTILRGSFTPIGDFGRGLT
jgi:hypothetical protein